MLQNMRQKGSGQRQQMAQWFLCRLFIEKNYLKKMEAIPCCFMLTDLMVLTVTRISTAALLTCWIVDLSMRSLTFAAARNWEDNGLKMADCFTKKIRSAILLIV